MVPSWLSTIGYWLFWLQRRRQDIFTPSKTPTGFRKQPKASAPRATLQNFSL
jgi:hypothetical protein